MAMDINQFNQSSNVSKAREAAVPTAGRNEQPVENKATGQSNTQDTVSLTDAGNAVKRLEDRMAQQPVVDTQKVERIKAAIAEGSYQVDSASIAKKLSAFETLMVGNSAR